MKSDEEAKRFTEVNRDTKKGLFDIEQTIHRIDRIVKALFKGSTDERLSRRCLTAR